MQVRRNLHRLKYGSLFLCLLGIMLMLSSVIHVSPGSAESHGENLNVGIPADRCPIFYRDGNTGEATGIGVDLMRAAAENAGYTVTFRFIEEETLKDALDNETYDVILPFGSAITSTSGHSMLVSGNLMQTPFTFVTTGKRVLHFQEGLRVGMLRSLGGVVETLGQLYPDMEIKGYDSMEESVKAIRSGEVDALLNNSYVWAYVLQKPAYSDLAVQPSTVFSMDFRAGTLDTPEGQERIERLNGSIATLTDTRRQAVILDYTSRKLYQYDFFDYLYRYWLIGLLVLLLFAAVVVIAIQRVHTVSREHEKKMQQMIDHDPLTGLLSMSGFRKRVEELLHAHPDAPYYLSYNNIRGFKYINDSLGREAGDDLLRFWAAKSKENLSDEETIGRITGDRFAVLRHITGEDETQSDKEKVFAPTQNYFIDRGKKNKVQICSGIYVLTPKDFRKIDVDHMLDLARLAEKRARESRKEEFAFYNPDQWERGKQIADVVNFLPTALQSGDIQVWYQPQVDYSTGTITGAEALCRWDHNKLGWLYPQGFIEILEEAGLIYDLDSFVWERVCQDLRRWKDQGYHKSVSVNVSRDDIRNDRDIPGQFSKLIQTYGLTPDQLRIEITETAYVESSEILIETTEKLRALGFQVEMDDFGSGYSSLHMLKEVPVDRIKLDMHFLTASGDPKKSRIIVSCMIQMVGMLGMAMIAEGVENVEQAKFLHGKGCQEMQGYYFFKPMPVQDFEKIMNEGTEHSASQEA